MRALRLAASKEDAVFLRVIVARHSNAQQRTVRHSNALKMSLISLPLELFQATITETVWLVGLRQAVNLRLVCKLFDTEAKRAICALPTFDTAYRHSLPDGLQLPQKMDLAMTTTLILTKMNAKDAAKRPLCLAITRAVDHLEDEFGQKKAGLRLEFIEALARASVHALPLCEITDCLVTNPTVQIDNLWWSRENEPWRFHTFRRKHPGVEPLRHPIEYLAPSSDKYADTTREGALIAALSTKRFQLARRLLESGVNGITTSYAFGVPLKVAALTGAQEIVRMILDRVLGQRKEDDLEAPDIIESARQCVLQGAAANGHVHILRMIWEVPEYNWESLGTGLTRSIKLAVENGHEGIASFLLQHRTPIPLRESAQHDSRQALERRELKFWRNLTTTATRLDCENILRIALEHFPYENDEWISHELKKGA
ncbi:uncharacterized protein BDR25DRAFT_375141 [Lindgomyces ingoldianus]|uniref:Uncharacterized protein n=1 Tax=Lindgomyces ingoldianus TaxID=673940 RepID=A0ACB6RBZ5_9PLEO|nr:uncharacterized protein BDR25DRAFT_375141 [Lindgomyces ingoldianus]KAF2476288.1 hypothetical protein BDR25DRAFT_375141 [Lindgomyces ingoldianus]